MATDNRATVAQQLYDAFISDTRTNGEKFDRLADGSPQWMTDIVRAAHGDMMPDDMRYTMIRECLSNLVDYDPDDWQDRDSEIADSLVDVYNTARVRWLASHLSRGAYCDEALEEGIADRESVYNIIGSGQYMEYREILAQLIGAIEERAEELAESGDETDDDSDE